MSDDIDIVDRLRISWTSMTAMGNAEREEAADEIERLRKENDDMRAIVALQGEVVKLAQRRHEERDEARRMYCLAASEKDKHLSAEDVADTWGWDCFKENPDY